MVVFAGSKALTAPVLILKLPLPPGLPWARSAQMRVATDDFMYCWPDMLWTSSAAVGLCRPASR